MGRPHSSARCRATLFSGLSLGILLVLMSLGSCASAPRAGKLPSKAESPLAPDAGGVPADRSASDSILAEKASSAPELAPAAAPPPATASAAAPAAPRPAPSQSGLKAGFSDDNEQFNYFAKFLDQYASVPHYELAIGERIALRAVDPLGLPVANAELSVKAGGKLLDRGITYSDGLYYLYPLELGTYQSYSVELSSKEGSAAVEVQRGGPRSISIALGSPRRVESPLPVDVLFVLDTTGSMGEEIERLRSTIEIISANITALKPRPELRFGMVLYKDRDDLYDTKIVPFTSDLDKFQAALDDVRADGGGDEPEDLQSALRDALGSMKWNQRGLRLGFIVTDASTHLDDSQSYTYARAAREAKARGIKFFSIGAGGLPLEGEYLLRQVAQYTQGKYIFLTYGEGGESSGGREASVSHHTGANFATDKLEAIVIKFVREEIARQSDRPLEGEQPYSDARRVDDETREDTLGKLFSQALQDLSDYSSLRLGPEAKLAIMPLAAAGEAQDSVAAAQAEFFGAQLALAASKSKLFTLVERADLQSILGELELQLSGLADEEKAAKAGRILGADYLVTGTVFRGPERYELFLKLLRVETAELLSATKARIDPALGL